MIALALILHSFRRARGLLAGMGAVFFVFQVLMAAAGRTLQRSGAFEQLAAFVPDFVWVLLGPSFVAMLSLSGMVGIGYFHVVVIGGLVAFAVAVATEPAGEIESGFADLVLSRPVVRAAIVTRSVVLLISSTLLLIGIMLAGTFLGLAWIVGRDAGAPPPRLVLLLAANLAALVFCCGGLSLPIGASLRRRSVAGALASLLLLALFLLDFVGRIWKPGEALAKLSPFRYFNPLEILLTNRASAVHLAILVMTGAAGCALAYVVFSRRDI